VETWSFDVGRVRRAIQQGHALRTASYAVLPDGPAGRRLVGRSRAINVKGGGQEFEDDEQDCAGDAADEARNAEPYVDSLPWASAWDAIA